MRSESCFVEGRQWKAGTGWEKKVDFEIALRDSAGCSYVDSNCMI